MTHLPNKVALKMDGAQACHRYSTVAAGRTRQRVRGRGGGGAASGASPRGTASSADLGGSSKYSRESLED